MLYVPEDFAHGFITLEDDTEVTYLVTEFYTPGAEAGIRWNDVQFDIKWPLEPKVISEKDKIQLIVSPNPANDVVTVSINANGDASLEVTDIAGKTAMSNTLTLVNGSANVDMSSLESGVYIFSVTLENGQTSQFNVVKN